MNHRAKPNIIVLMTDQQRVGYTAGEGGPDTMPRLDALMAEACRFERAYTSSPLCVPARTSMLTGRFPTAHRVRQNSNAEHATYEQDLLDVLGDAGYSLHFSGKPHMHAEPSRFESYAGPYLHDGGPRETAVHEEFDAWLHDLDHGVAEEPTPFPVSAQLPHRIVDSAIASLDAAPKDRPFFLFASFPEPHNPYQVPAPYFGMFDSQVPERIADADDLHLLDWRFRWLRDLIEEKRPGYDDLWRRYRSNYMGMLRLIDDQIGRLVDHLGEVAEETMFVFLTDHGDFVGDYGLQRKGAAMPEALMRIPLLFTGPGVARQTRSELVSIVDLLPTLAECVTGQIPVGVQGRSLAPLLRGEEAPRDEFGSIYGELGYGGISYDEDSRPPLHFPYSGSRFDELNSVTMGGEMRMLVEGRHKLVVDDRGRHWLYDLEADPAELHDLSEDAESRELLSAMDRKLVRWMMRAADDLPTGNYTPRTRPHNWRWA